MEHAIITKGKLKTSRTLILDEDIFSKDETFEIILRPVKKTLKPARSAYCNVIHINYETEDTLKDLIDFN